MCIVVTRIEILFIETISDIVNSICFLRLNSKNIRYNHHKHSLPYSLYPTRSHTTEKPRDTILLINILQILPKTFGLIPLRHILLHNDPRRLHGSVPTTTQTANHPTPNLTQQTELTHLQLRPGDFRETTARRPVRGLTDTHGPAANEHALNSFFGNYAFGDRPRVVVFHSGSFLIHIERGKDHASGGHYNGLGESSYYSGAEGC
mmetsp:Transcript_47261/g.57220  ORF Transcript_47261/g.57220 Transcript_47261/m.57220 type:complete len:205 (-) Transcript_47261:799-1413(-)